MISQIGQTRLDMPEEDEDQLFYHKVLALENILHFLR